MAQGFGSGFGIPTHKPSQTFWKGSAIRSRHERFVSMSIPFIHPGRVLRTVDARSCAPAEVVAKLLEYKAEATWFLLLEV